MNIDFAQQRIKMVDGQVRTTDVTDTAILDAMLSVPREAFLPSHRQALAYIDEDIQVAAAEEGRAARYLMEPSPFARLLQLARIRPSDFVLDVGAGCGYSSAVMSRLGSFVVALEDHPDLQASANAALSRLGYDNVAVVDGQLEAGYPAEAPYDVIFVNGSVEVEPKSLFAQLKDGGRLVVVQGSGNAGRAFLYRKDDGLVSHRAAFNAAVKPLGAFLREAAFVF